MSSLVQQPDVFQSTLSVRRATNAAFTLARAPVFQSTLSVRRATIYMYANDHGPVFQSTLSVRRATFERVWRGSPSDISIHALRKESDIRTRMIRFVIIYFNPRSP